MILLYIILSVFMQEKRIQVSDVLGIYWHKTVFNMMCQETSYYQQFKLTSKIDSLWNIIVEFFFSLIRVTLPYALGRPAWISIQSKVLRQLFSCGYTITPFGVQ